MEKLTVEAIAKIIYENHEEQCCTCSPWGEDSWRYSDGEARPMPFDAERDQPLFYYPAKAVHEAIYGRTPECTICNEHHEGEKKPNYRCANCGRSDMTLALYYTKDRLDLVCRACRDNELSE